MNSNENEFKIKINDIHSSLEYPSDFGKAKIFFYNFKEKLIYENKYLLNTTIKDLINDFYIKVSDKILFDKLNKGKYFNKKELKYYTKEGEIFELLNIDEKTISDQLITKIKDTLILIDTSKLSSSNKNRSFKKGIKEFHIYVKYKITYKHLSKNMEEYIINNIIFIGKPILNELGYYIYKKDTSQLKLVKISEYEIPINIKMKFFQRICTYCNANNYLFIYEGTNLVNNTFTSRYTLKSSINFNDKIFLKINLINEEINIISIKFPRRVLHSMIFIPEKYIFIIGGKYKKELKDVLIYKIKKDNHIYEKYPYLLPYGLLEPSLIMINNKYLYAFENSKEKFNVVKCDISIISPFEDIKIKNEKQIEQKFFGVVPKIENNRILFLGGQFLNLTNNLYPKNYEFDYNTNELILTNINYENFDFIEKTFIPIEKNNYLQITEFRLNDENIPKIIIYGDKNKSVKIINEEEKIKSKGKFFEEGFNSIESKNFKVFIKQSKDSVNINSIVPSSSNDEIFV